MTSQFQVETSNPEDFPPCKTFDEMGLPEDLLRGIFAYGWERPSAIQSVGIMPIVKNRDVLGQAQSGTGKTGCFGVGLLSRIDPTLQKTQALILAHTHELSDQIYKVLTALSSRMGVKVVLAIGGVPRHLNARECKAGAHVVVGTPGRVYDLASSGDLRFDSLRQFVVDEADEMLRDRFGDQINEIVRIGLPESCRVAFFSATMPPEVKALANRILNDPVRITLTEADVKLDGIRQFYVKVDDDSWKIDVFCDIFEGLTISSSIIFCNTKERAERLYSVLTERGFPVSVIYGDPMTQAQRKQRMDEFRSSQTKVLIATNLLARGIDVHHVNVVFNFDVPPFEDKENYIHRIGRCGRYGRKGTAINLVTATEKDTLDQIATHFSFQPQPLPQDLRGVVAE
jgi:translation initiation factor 4A